MSTLNEIVSAEKAITRFLETDEFPKEFIEAEAVRRELPNKVDGYKVVMDRLEIEEKYFKSQSDTFLTASKRLKNLRTNLKLRIKESMEFLGKTELKGNDFRFKTSPVKAKVLVDLESLDGKFLVEKIDYKPDLELLRERIEAGDVIQGAELEYGTSLRIYVNKKGDTK